jgi:outer membrane protein OmpA-like peptidoglycan-associated protein
VKRAALACVVLLLTLRAEAQTADPFAGVELNLLEPTPFADSGVVTDVAQRSSQWNYSAQLLIHYALNPLVWRYPDNSASIAVGHQLMGHVMAHVSFLSWLSVGIDLPVSLAFIPVDLRDLSPAPPVTALGDLKLAIKATFLDQFKHGINMGIAADIAFPTSGGRAYIGSNTISGYPRLIVSRRFSGVFELALNLGARLRVGREVINNFVASQLSYNVMARAILPWRAGPTSYEVTGELWGLTSAVRPFQREGENALEWLVSARVGFFDNVYLTAGVGGGLIGGYGSPDFRALLGVAWAPRERDRDNDGILDGKDACPDVAEWVNGVEDGDGCPESDRDSDGIVDALDKCPDERETRNGFEDDDGCPDRKPRKLKKKCKESDVVYDADENDEPDEATEVEEDCPQEPPPPPPASKPSRPQDHDRDGVFDTDDKCPDEPETINGNNDDDGCPDEGKGVTVFVSKQKIQILEKINFETGSAVIKTESFTILDQVSAQLRAHPEVRLLRIEGHTDSVGADAYNMKLSAARAASVRTYLIEKGRVEAERLAAQGYGETRPIASNNTPRGKAQNRRVEFVIVEQGDQ